MIFKKNKKLDIAVRLMLVLLASSIAAAGNLFFLLPHDITPGGFGGFATIINRTILPRVPIGVITLILNVPLYLVALKLIGNVFGMLSVAGTVGYSVTLDLLSQLPKWSIDDKLLSCIYGGVLIGIGFGAILRLGGSTGGSDMLSFVINHYKPSMSLGTILLLFDGCVITIAGLVFGLESALRAFITIFLCSKVVDYLMDGRKMSKVYYIISNKSEEIALTIMEKMHRGVTGLKGKGMYTKRDKDVLMVIVLRSQAQMLKNLIHDIDDTAFVIATNVQEVFGEGFIKLRKNEFKRKKTQADLLKVSTTTIPTDPNDSTAIEETLNVSTETGQDQTE